MKKILVAIMMVAMMFAISPVPAAQAAGNAMYHWSPDDGYDAPIWIKCGGNGVDFGVREGSSSNIACNVNGGSGYIDKVYVRQDEEIWCKYADGWDKRFDAWGWHDVGWSYNYGQGCVLKRD